MRRFAVVFMLLVAGLLAAQEMDWSKAEPVQTGVLLLKIARTEPRLQKINLMRIDLSTPGLRFTGTGRAAEWGKPMPDYPKQDIPIRTKRIRTADFMKDARKNGEKMIVAANSAPWWPWTAPYTFEFAHPAGLNILNGEVICDGAQKAEFVVYRDGRAAILPQVPKEDYAKITVAAGGFAILLKDGKKIAGGDYEIQLHPRIAYGLSQDRKFLYILTVDGRQKDWSLGANGTELAEMLLAAGASDGINMDGGGSASLCYWDEKAGAPVMVNRHSAKGYARPVGSNIGIVLDSPEKKK